MAGRKKSYNAKELKTFMNLLIEKKRKLVEDLSNLEDSNLFAKGKENSSEISGHTNHMADVAADYTSLETNFDLAEREGKYLVYLEEAIQRVKDGTFGICKVCEGLIPVSRLEAVPTATKCVDCKNEVKKQEEKDIQAELARMYLSQHQKK